MVGVDRDVDLVIDELPAARYRLRHRRLDEQHSNLNARWADIADGRAWPEGSEWSTLQEQDHDDLEPARSVEPRGGAVELRFALPMPGVSLIELEPQ